MLKIVRGKSRRKNTMRYTHTIRCNLVYFFDWRQENVPVTSVLTLHPQIKTDANKDHFQEFNPALGRTDIFNVNKERGLKG